MVLSNPWPTLKNMLNLSKSFKCSWLICLVISMHLARRHSRTFTFAQDHLLQTLVLQPSFLEKHAWKSSRKQTIFPKNETRRKHKKKPEKTKKTPPTTQLFKIDDSDKTPGENRDPDWGRELPEIAREFCEKKTGENISNDKKLCWTVLSFQHWYGQILMNNFLVFVSNRHTNFAKPELSKKLKLLYCFFRLAHVMLCLHLTTAVLVQSWWQQFISGWLFPVFFKRKVAFTSESRNVSMIYRSKLKTNSFIAKIGTNPGFNLKSGLDLMAWFCPTHDQP